jgi:AcrR family transcriptional regulator
MAPMLPFYIREDDPPAKRQILRAAMKLFSAHGLDATSIRDIARESGYTNPALYKHFAGKEELALHLFETCHRRLWGGKAASTVRRASTASWRHVAGPRAWTSIRKHRFLSDSGRVSQRRAGGPATHDIGLAPP